MKKAATTRLTILQKAFELIYVKGYQTTSIDDIIATTQVTKGAFYYHFKNKDEMGLAIINEILKHTHEKFYRTVAKRTKSIGRYLQLNSQPANGKRVLEG
jgi:TetR/AcrR family transcriptional repressor of nem operon